MKYFCNTCGFVEDNESSNHGATDTGYCPCGADNWLEINDPVITPRGTKTVAQLREQGCKLVYCTFSLKSGGRHVGVPYPYTVKK